MHRIIASYLKLTHRLQSWESVPLFLLRITLAYGFYSTASMKWKDIHAVAEWFGTLGIPAPTFNAYLAAGTETAGVVLLILGMGTRLITVPLIITMLVAIKTVHWANGFEAGDNGFEIPLYYLLMLLTLFIFGAGKWSIDYFVEKKCRQKCNL